MKNTNDRSTTIEVQIVMLNQAMRDMGFNGESVKTITATLEHKVQHFESALKDIQELRDLRMNAPTIIEGLKT